MTLTLEHDWFPEPLPSNVSVGDRSWLHSSYAFIHYRSARPWVVRIGNDTGVYVGTMFDLGPHGEVEIGDYCVIAGPLFSTDRRIVIGDYTLLSYDIVLADSAWALPPDSAPQGSGGRRSSAADDIVIGQNCWIGAKAILLGGTRLGEGVIVGAASVVANEVPDYAVVAGNPARVVGWARPGQHP